MRHRVSSAVTVVYSGCTGKAVAEVAVPPQAYRGVGRTAQHNTTQHNTTQHNTTQHNTTQHNTTHHNIYGSRHGLTNTQPRERAHTSRLAPRWLRAVRWAPNASSSDSARCVCIRACTCVRACVRAYVSARMHPCVCVCRGVLAACTQGHMHACTRSSWPLAPSPSVEPTVSHRKRTVRSTSSVFPDELSPVNINACRPTNISACRPQTAMQVCPSASIPVLKKKQLSKTTQSRLPGD